MENIIKKRFFLFMVINSILISVWVAYLFTIQIFDPYGFENSRQVRYTPVKELQNPIRGYIYDRNGELLVRTVRFYQIDYDRSRLNEDTYKDSSRSIAKIISDNSSLSYNYVHGRFVNTPGRTSIYISDRVREADLISIERELEKKGFHRGLITRFSFQQRVYPKGNLASRLIGVVRENRDNENASASSLSRLEGLTGIERSYDNDLQGVYGWRKLFLDARNNPIIIPNLGKQRVINGKNIELTIDSRIQEIVEMNLREGLRTFGAKNGIGIFMNPKTGEILAMASVSENEKNLSPAEIRGLPNLAVSFLFEPGSTIKSFTALAALDKKAFTTVDTLDCRTYRLPGRTIRDSHPYKYLSFRDIIAHSSNVGTSKIAEAIGSRSLYEMLISSGFGNRSGSDIYGESAGVLRKVRDWQGFSLHSISFGQEMSCTALQLAVAYAAIANDGKLMKPYIVNSIRSENGNLSRETRPTTIRSIAKPAAVDTLKTIMRDAVVYGTGTGTKLPYVSIGGKTGTAEKQIEGTAGYAKGKYVANFAGFFPVENPQMVGVIIYDEPAYYYHYASMSAVVTFRNIVEQMLALPNCDIVPNVRLMSAEFAAVPDVIGKKTEEAVGILEKAGFEVQTVGNIEVSNAVVVNQYPKHNIELELGRQAIIIVDNPANDLLEINAGASGSGQYGALSRQASEAGSTNEMPDLVGLTLRKGVQKAKRHNVRLEINGVGRIVRQSIPAGRTINYGDECIVTAN